VVQLVDKFCANLIARVKEEYGFETDNARELDSALGCTCSRVDHSSKFARQLVEHGRPVDVLTLSPLVRASLLAAARASPVPIDARLAVNFRPRTIGVDEVEPIVGCVDIDRVACSDNAAEGDSVKPAADYSRRSAAGIRHRQGSSSSEGSGGNVRGSAVGPTAATIAGTVETAEGLSDSGAAGVHEPVLLASFAARTSTDNKGCKPTGVAAAALCDDGSTTLIAVVDDINKKVKVFDDAGQLQLEICPDGRQRLVDPWDVAVLRPVRASKATTQAAFAGRYVVTDRGAKDVKVFDSSGEFVSSFGPHLSTPWGVCTNAARQVLVSDSTHRTVFVHDSAGVLLFHVEVFKHTLGGIRYHLQVTSSTLVCGFGHNPNMLQLRAWSSLSVEA